MDPRTPEYVSHLARDSARYLEVLRQTAPGTRVPTCPDWDADDLLWHLAEVQWFWGTIVSRELTPRGRARRGRCRLVAADGSESETAEPAAATVRGAAADLNC